MGDAMVKLLNHGAVQEKVGEGGEDRGRLNKASWCDCLLEHAPPPPSALSSLRARREVVGTAEAAVVVCWAGSPSHVRRGDGLQDPRRPVGEVAVVPELVPRRLYLCDDLCTCALEG